jgi:putative colanic acid biosynthesis acetyltransferase WcaF
MRLDRYSLGDYNPGAPVLKQFIWFYFGLPLLSSHWFFFSNFKVLLLKAFGASIGRNVIIKPGVRVKFPWRLVLGNFVWLGENCWIDNIAAVTIGSHVCISQSVYLCTGNHDWSHPEFVLKAAPIEIQDGSWIAAKAVIGPGVTVGHGAVLCLGSVAGQSLEPMTIYAGNPAKPIKNRVLRLEYQKIHKYL